MLQKITTFTIFGQLCLGAGVLPLSLHGENNAAGAETTHQLFVGTDVTVKWHNDFVKVAGFDGSLVVVRDPEAQPVVLRKADQFRWERRPKVSRAPVTIHNLDHTRLYSISRDPATKWNAVQAAMSAQQDTRTDLATGEMVAVSGGQGPNQATMKQLYQVVPGRNSGMQVPDHGQYSEDLRSGRITLGQVADAASNVMTQTLDQGLNLPGQEVFQERINADNRAEAFDSFELRFDIASREPIADAYAVIRAKVVTDADTDGSVILFHEHIGRLDTSPRRITVRKAGLPDGFTLEDVRVEIYAHGIEIGSNLSERSRPLSTNAARGFLLLAHLADHQGETLPPSPVWDLAPAELWAAPDGGAFDLPVVVSLDQHGQILGIHRTETQARASLAIVNESEIRTKRTGETLTGMENLSAPRTPSELDQTGQLPPQIVSIVGRMVFMPALEEGYPVPSISRINLADFFR